MQFKETYKIVFILIIAEDKIIVVVMEENNDIFLAGGNAIVYLAGPLHKKYSITFVCGHPFSMYVSYDRFFNPLSPLYAYVGV